MKKGINIMEETFKIIVNGMVKDGISYNINKHKKLLEEILIKLNSDITEKEQQLLNNRLNVLLDLENHYDNGRVYYTMNTWGTVTGRPSTTDFNVSSIPSKKVLYGKEIRECFEVKEGKIMIGFDASQIELRLLAHFMKDENYIKIVENGDIHTLNQHKAGLNTREEAKKFIYKMNYGGGIKIISETLNCSFEEAKKIKERFLNETPMLQDLLNKLSKRTKIKTLEGKEIIITDKYKALNYLLQSNASVIMKRAIIIAYQKIVDLGLLKHIKLVINVYDECHYEVDNEYLDKSKEILSSCVEEAGNYYNLRCKLSSEIKIGQSWAETH